MTESDRRMAMLVYQIIEGLESPVSSCGWWPEAYYLRYISRSLMARMAGTYVETFPGPPTKPITTLQETMDADQPEEG